MLRRIPCLFWLCFFAAVAGKAQTGARSWSDLSGPWQLFIDDYGIAEMSGLTRRYHQFEKDARNPVPGQPGGRATVFPGNDGTGYVRWAGNSVAKSADGRTWKSMPGVKDYQDSRGNPVVLHTPWDIGREFKMIGGRYSGLPDRRVQYGRYGSYSTDGIQWRDVPSNPIVLADGDTGTFNWDPLTRRYFGTPKLLAYVRGSSRRCVGLVASDRFESGWSAPELVLVPDEFDDRWIEKPGQRTEFYNLSAFAYESMYLGFLEVFRNTDGWKDGRIFIELVTSRDGIHWDRVAGARTPLLPLGATGAWDSGMVKVPNQPLVRADRIELFYHGGEHSHGYGRKEYPTFGDIAKSWMGIATLRKDGFASLDAGPQPGVVMTRNVHGLSGTLRVNYRTRGGWLRAEVVAADGKAMPGYGSSDCGPLTGDATDAVVAWGSRRELPAGGPFRFRFTLQNASLFSYTAGPATRIETSQRAIEILYTFEGGPRLAMTDRLHADGVQRLFPLNAVMVDDDTTAMGKQSPAAFGKAEVMLLPDGEHARMLRGSSSYAGRNGFPAGVTWNALEIENSFRLGESFTLAAMVRVGSRKKGRLFSTWEPPVMGAPPYQRKTWIEPDEFVFDLDAAGASPFGCMRVSIHGTEVSAAGRFDDNRYQHVAVTYRAGNVRLYLDGKEVGRGDVPAGRVALRSNLHVGGNPGSRWGYATPESADQLEGLLDDILVLGRELAPAELGIAAAQGAERLFAIDGRAHTAK